MINCLRREKNKNKKNQKTEDNLIKGERNLFRLKK